MRTLKEAIIDASDEYFKSNSTFPKQFNIQRIRKNEEIGWRCEFFDTPETWYDCTRWFSGEEALKIFFSRDPEKVYIELWDEQFDEIIND